MGKALAKINAAWAEHVAQVGDSADYGSFLAGWVGAEYAALPENEAEPTTATLWPDRLNTDADVDLDWPDGTRAVDREGDGYVVYKGAWIWDTNAGGETRKKPHQFDTFVSETGGQGSRDTLRYALPARIISIGKEDN